MVYIFWILCSNIISLCSIQDKSSFQNLNIPINIQIYLNSLKRLLTKRDDYAKPSVNFAAVEGPSKNGNSSRIMLSEPTFRPSDECHSCPTIKLRGTNLISMHVQPLFYNRNSFTNFTLCLKRNIYLKFIYILRQI